MAIRFIPAVTDRNGEVLDEVLLDAVLLLQQRYCEATLERGALPADVMAKYRQAQKPVPLRRSNVAKLLKRAELFIAIAPYLHFTMEEYPADEAFWPNTSAGRPN